MFFNIKSRAVSVSVGCLAFLTLGCLTDNNKKTDPTMTAFPQTLFVTHGTTLASYNLATGVQNPGTITNVNSPVDMQALADGTILVNLSATNEILVIDAKTMLEKKRIPSSSLGATRPVHSYITPTYAGKTYWITLNDGGGTAVTNSALFVGITPTDTVTYLKPVGEIGLGIGHHKATFSSTTSRVVISSIGDTGDVVSVFDYSNPARIQKVAKASVGSLGILGGRATPHGCATAKLTGKGYCNATATGDIISIDIDAATPTFKLIKTRGSGAGYTKAHPAGRYIYALQKFPREGDTVRAGSMCQIGQVAVIDAQTDTVVREVVLKYGSPSCASSIVGTPANSVGPGHILFSGNQMFVQLASSVAGDYSTKQLVLDITDPSTPVQTAALEIGQSSGDHGETLSGDGKYLLETNSNQNTVSQIDVSTASVVKTITVQANPKTVATWGESEGPSHHVGPLD